MPRRLHRDDVEHTASGDQRPGRDFIRLAGLAGLSAASGFPAVGRRALAAPPMFEEIPSSASGITWIHENAMSPERYLPETMGPGVAVFDYDNDGWMDVFMVNSGGPVDFWKPTTPTTANPERR